MLYSSLLEVPVCERNAVQIDMGRTNHNMIGMAASVIVNAQLRRAQCPKKCVERQFVVTCPSWRLAPHP